MLCYTNPGGALGERFSNPKIELSLSFTGRINIAGCENTTRLNITTDNIISKLESRSSRTIASCE